MIIDFCKLEPRLGRVRHLGLFSFWLGIMVIGVFLGLGNIISKKVAWIFDLLIFIGVINIIFIKIRRLHDFNCSGWWIVGCFIPIIGIIWTLAIFCIPGTAGNNHYSTQSGDPTRWDYLLILTTPLTYFILYLLGIYDLT